MAASGKSSPMNEINCFDVENTVIIVAGDQSYKCNKNLLMKNSDWFRRNIDKLMICNDHKNGLRLSLRHVSPEIFSVVYDWIWSKKIPKNCDVVRVMKAAKRLQMPGLINECQELLQCKNLNMLNAMLKYDEAVCYDVPVEIEKTQVFLCKNFSKIVNCKIYFTYTAEQMCNLLDFDDLDICSEVEVFDAAFGWLKNNWGIRNQYVIEVLSVVRYGLMNDVELLELMLDPRCSIIMELEKIQLLFLNGFFYHIAVENNKLDQYPDLIPRKRSKLEQKMAMQNSTKTMPWPPSFIDNYISPIPLTPVSVLTPQQSIDTTPRIIQSADVTPHSSKTESTRRRRIDEILNEKNCLKPLECPMNCFAKFPLSETESEPETDDDYVSALRYKDVLGARKCEETCKTQLPECELTGKNDFHVSMSCKIPENFNFPQRTTGIWDFSKK